MARFSITCNMNSRGLATLFKHKLFTIDALIRKDWEYDKLEQYLLSYKLSVSPQVLQTCSPEAKALLTEMLQQDSYFTIKKNNSDRYSGKKQYIKCQVPIYVLGYMKKLFVSTIIYSANPKIGNIPKKESIVFTFDTSPVDNQPTVSITTLNLYEPTDNPYYMYARNAASALSVEAIGLNQYNLSNEGKVKDFYDWDKISKWKERGKFFQQVDGRIVEVKDKNGTPAESIIDGQPGVYMLYDKNSNQFYLGKAKNLRKRILRHAEDPQGNDPIPNFTHYRYSVINLEYLQFLYLIENVGIHDCAWLLNMPKAQKFTPALSNLPGIDLNTCKQVNTHERQRKIETDSNH